MSSIVTKVSADGQEGEHIRCSGNNTEIRAETDPPDALPAWYVNDEYVPIGQHAFVIRGIYAGIYGLVVAPGETKKFTAKLENEVSVNVTTAITPSLDLEIEPEPEDGMYLITAEPSMPPALTATVVNRSGLVPSMSRSIWVAKIEHTGTLGAEICFPNFPSDLVPQTFDLSVTGGATQAVVDFGDKLRGGSLTVYMQAAGPEGCRIGASIDTGVYVGGTNPQRSDVEDALPHATLRAIACHESGQRQFDAPADGGISKCPLFRCGDKVGVMQIADPNPDEIWNWRTNVASGIEIFNEKVENARNYPSRVRGSSGFQSLVALLNQYRQTQGLDPISVRLPDFSTGNFDDDLQQLEMDAIRGYNGWFGSDRFGFELHEFRVAVDEVDGLEILRVTNVNEQDLEGEAVWERVPTQIRPTEGECSDTNYVDKVMPYILLAGCGDHSSPTHSCQLSIQPSQAAARSFHPPRVTGIESTFSARIGSSPQLPENAKIRWFVYSPNEPLSSDDLPFPGSVEFVNDEGETAVVQPRHPNKTSIFAGVFVGDQPIPICLSYTPIELSVPQFIQIVLDSDFDTDLERIGLKRRPPADGSSLTTGQKQANTRVRDAVIKEMMETLRRNFLGINVRFTFDDPSSIVGQRNFSKAIIGGTYQRISMDPKQIQPTDRSSIFGFAGYDPGNHKAYGDPDAHVFSGKFSDRSVPILRDSGEYIDIFNAFAIEDLNGSILPGEPVNEGDFHDSSSDLIREKYIKAAIIAFGRFLGTATSHECGHLIGLKHESHIMLAPLMTFKDYTGINYFNNTTGDIDVVDSMKFSNPDVEYMLRHLPIY